MTTIINASTVSGLVNSADTSGILQLQTASTAALTITAAQNVGIGTASPDRKLYVQTPTAGVSLGSNAVVFSDAVAATMELKQSTTENQWSSNTAMSFATNGAEAIRIDSSRNVGIGTASPSSFGKVAVSVAGTTTPTTVTNVGSSSINLYSATNGGSTSATCGIFGWNDPSGIASGIGFSRENSADWGTQLRFYTHPTTTSNIGDITERMRIDSSGSVLINKTSRQADEGLGITGKTSSQCAVLVSPISGDYDMINFRNTNGQVGRIGCNGSATSYITSSDYRLKENIAPMTGALAKVAQLKPVTYKWKVDGSDGQGFIAHELAEIVPDCVSGEKDAVDAEGKPIHQGIDTSFLVATLTAALQELKQINDTQAETINALTARIVALEQK